MALGWTVYGHSRGWWPLLRHLSRAIIRCPRSCPMRVLRHRRREVAPFAREHGQWPSAVLGLTDVYRMVGEWEDAGKTKLA